MADKDKTTHLTPQQLEEFRQMLIQKRKELLEDIAQLGVELDSQKHPGDQGGASNMPTHPADAGTDAYEQELSTEKLVRQRSRLAEIDEALGRVADGTFGICMGTGKPIEMKRLLASPWARYSLEYAKQMEEKGVRLS